MFGMKSWAYKEFSLISDYVGKDSIVIDKDISIPAGTTMWGHIREGVILDVFTKDAEGISYDESLFVDLGYCEAITRDIITSIATILPRFTVALEDTAKVLSGDLDECDLIFLAITCRISNRWLVDNNIKLYRERGHLIWQEGDILLSVDLVPKGVEVYKGIPYESAESISERGLGL